MVGTEIAPLVPEELHGLDTLSQFGKGAESAGDMLQLMPEDMPLTVQLSVDGLPLRTRVARSDINEGSGAELSGVKLSVPCPEEQLKV